VQITLSSNALLNPVHAQATLGAQAYEAFSAMLRVNTSLNLKLPPFETAGADARLLEMSQLDAY
jgi:hypothetical protein